MQMMINLLNHTIQDSTFWNSNANYFPEADCWLMFGNESKSLNIQQTYKTRTQSREKTFIIAHLLHVRSHQFFSTIFFFRCANKFFGS